MSTVLASAAEPTWSPLRVAIECQTSARVDACAFLRTVLDDVDVVAVGPRSEAQVVAYVNATRDANDDLVLFRLVGEVAGAPGVYEQLQRVDSRLGVEEQLDRLEPAVLRALAPFVAAQIPEAMSVEFKAPETADRVDSRTRPWGITSWLGGFGWWTGDYQELSLWTGGALYRVTAANRAGLWVGYNRNIERQPALEVDENVVSLSVDSSSLEGLTHASWNLDEHWTVGAVGRVGRDDPDGQYLRTGRAHIGIERNWFPSDDPRGNRLAAGYLLGAQTDAYNRRNVLGETRAVFPTHLLLLEGEVRVDTVELEAELAVKGELLNPLRRYAVSADVSADIILGDHVDLVLGYGITQQAVPGPADLDESDFEVLTRASYAEPLQMYGDLNLRFHFDNTNGARNNRFESATNLDPRDNL